MEPGWYTGHRAGTPYPQHLEVTAVLTPWPGQQPPPPAAQSPGSTEPSGSQRACDERSEPPEPSRQRSAPLGTSARLRTVRPSTSPGPLPSATLWGGHTCACTGNGKGAGVPSANRGLNSPRFPGFPPVVYWASRALKSASQDVHPVSPWKRPPAAHQKQVQSTGNCPECFISMTAVALCPVPAGAASYTVSKEILDKAENHRGYSRLPLTPQSQEECLQGFSGGLFGHSSAPPPPAPAL